MDDILDNIIKGVAATIEINEEIEENLEKIFRIKNRDILNLLNKKNINMTEYELNEKLTHQSEKYFINFLEKEIRFYLSQFIDFPFWEGYKITTLKENIASYLNTFIKKNLPNKKFRKNFFNIVNLLKSDLILRYCEGLYSRKGYGSRYLFAKPNSAPSLLNEFLKISLFFFNISLISIEFNGEAHYIEQYLASKEGIGNYFHLLEKYALSTFGDIPFELIKVGIEASINKQKLKYEMDASNRADLLRIFFHMAKFQQKQAATNKRAETPEKSLLSLFQKDAQFLGLDKNFLYELEMIAREHRW